MTHRPTPAAPLSITLTLATAAAPACDDPARRAGLGRLAALGLTGLGAGLLQALSGCAGMPAGLRQFEVPADKLREGLASQFPRRQKVMDVFELNLSLPQLSLDPANNRIVTSFDLALEETLLTRKTFRGSLGFASGLRYAAADHSICLQNVSLEKLALPGVPASLGGQVRQVGQLAAQTFLEGLAVYHLPKNMAQLVDTLGTAPDQLKVTATGLSVSFKPLAA